MAAGHDREGEEVAERAAVELGLARADELRLGAHEEERGTRRSSKAGGWAASSR